MDPRSIADALIVAERQRTAIAPFTDADPALDAETGYQAQRMVLTYRLDRGERLIGAKLGLVSRAKQEAMGVHEPLYGWLTSGMVHPHGEPLPLGELIHPRVEPEIAFLIGRELRVPATIISVLEATEAVLAAVEVLDSRYQDFRFRLPDVIADNASGSRVVLGPRARVPGDLCDLRLLGCVLRAQGDVAATAAGGAVMGHPAAAVAWLVNRLCPEDWRLEPGALVLSGGLTAPVPMRPGSVVSAEFDGLGTVDVYS
ncbi:MAG TPA: fumarylacetoacetate hydrolase family protein [Streptosporangiaceae bacterium]|nr:fumarylacetoacetate hydrolase family protein [Streptosporangiaceae bacterium]